jgi:hypothetical protein
MGLHQMFREQLMWVLMCEHGWQSLFHLQMATLRCCAYFASSR